MVFENLDQKYDEVQRIASEHYENFPVVSLFIPKQLRKHIAVVYVFARQADDIADEGELSPEQRIICLDDYEGKLKSALEGDYHDDFWCALHLTIKEMKLTSDNFFKLIRAFKQDISKNRYSNFNEILDYCSCSANPVGRIILEIFDIRDEQLNSYSDHICTALQLTNFYQDVSIDYIKGRIYIPVDELNSFNVSEKDFELKRISSNFKSLIEYQVNRANDFFNEGKNLIQYLPIPLRYEIKWTVLGGQKILKKIRNIDYDVLNQRPILSKTNYIFLMIQAFVRT